MTVRAQNAKEKKFFEDVVEWAQAYGTVVEGEGYLMIHHSAGRSYKQNKVLIGYYFILPLPSSLHETHGNHELNITYHRKAFVAEFGNERDLFLGMVNDMQRIRKSVPQQEVLDAIAATRY